MDIDPDDYLAHYGVAGMHWGQRKLPVKSTTVNKNGKALSERKKRKNELHNAYAKKLSRERTAVRDDRSQKTKNLGKAEVATMLGGVGGWLVGRLARNPRVKGAAFIASIASSGTSIGLSIAENNSANKDLLRVYG